MLGTQAITYKPQFSQPLRLGLGVLGIFVLATLLENVLGLDFTVTLVLAAQIFLYVLLFKRPVWAMAALIVGQITLPTYVYFVGGVQVSAILTWSVLTLLLMVPILSQRGGIKLGSGARRVIIPTIILACIALIADLVNTDLTATFQYFRQEFSWLVILFLLPAAVKNERDLKRLALVALITCSVSAIYALKQWYTPGIRDDLFDGRMIGLTIHPSHLGYTMPLVMLPTIAVYFLRGVSSRARKLIMLLIILMALGLYYSFTRVGIFSLVPGLLLMALLMKGKPKKEIFLTLFIVGAAFFYYINMEGNRYTEGFTEESGSARPVLWQSGANVALDYPLLGIGSYQFKEISLDYASTVDPKFMENMGAGGVLGTHSVHNDFITVWTSFGTIALLAYLWLFVGIFQNFAEARRHSPTRFLKAFAIGCLGATTAYVFNSIFHNIFGPTMLLWLLAGFSVATVKLAAKRQANTKVSQVDTGKY